MSGYALTVGESNQRLRPIVAELVRVTNPNAEDFPPA